MTEDEADSRVLLRFCKSAVAFFPRVRRDPITAAADAIRRRALRDERVVYDVCPIAGGSPASR